MNGALLRVVLLGGAGLAAGCVSGSKVLAESEVLRADIDRARRNGAMRCAPTELAQAEANLEFALAELDQGESGRASAHIREADVASKRALELSRDCGPKRVLVREAPRVVLRIEQTDADGDGIFDKDDACANQAEDKDGYQDEDGCPDPDNDGDGTLDGADKCPNDAGPAPAGGCPDRDLDGVADAQDRCPEDPGPRENDGCRVYKMVVVKQDRIEIKKQIKFRTNSAKIVGAESTAILREVAEALRETPRIKKVRVEGHTDSVGSDAKNLRLSQGRANAVMAALIKLGVDPGRMEAVGYGEAKPIASNATAKGRAENRRTEFNIVEQ